MKLSVLQQKFCELYAQSGNGVKAYYDAGYKCKDEKNAASSAAKLLTLPHISAYLDQIRSELSKKHNITTERLMQEAAKIAFSGMDDIVEIDETGQPRLKPNASLNELDSISGSESSSTGKDGSSYSKGFSVKKSDRLKALDMLAKMIGAYDRDPADNQRNLADSAGRILDALRAVRKK